MSIRKFRWKSKLTKAVILRQAMSGGGLGSVSSNAGGRAPRYGSGFGNTVPSSSIERDKNANRQSEPQVRAMPTRTSNHVTAEYVPGRAGAGWSDDESDSCTTNLQPSTVVQHEDRQLDTFLMRNRSTYLQPSECAEYLRRNAGSRTAATQLKTIVDYIDSQIDLNHTEDNTGVWRRCSNALLLVESVLRSDSFEPPNIESLSVLASWCTEKRGKLASASNCDADSSGKSEVHNEMAILVYKLRKLELWALRVANLLRDANAS